LLLLLAGVGALWLVRDYLHSGRAAEAVAERLKSRLGGRGRIGTVDVGRAGSSLHGVGVYDPNAGPQAGPWVKAGDVQADVSGLDLLRKDLRPNQITVRGVAVTLRFDEAGHLLTKVPSQENVPPTEALPEIHLEQGRLTIQQAGRPDFVIANIDGTLRPEGEQLVLTGTVKDPTYGPWLVRGTVDRAANTATATLKTDGKVHVTQAMLNALPFISPAIWKQVQL